MGLLLRRVSLNINPDRRRSLSCHMGGPDVHEEGTES